MASLKANSTLTELQSYIAEIERERGFSEESALQKCLLLGEEVGELFKAVRVHSGIKVDPGSNLPSVREEIADVLIFLVAIANRMKVDLESAVRDKEYKNNGRTWR